ncbi:hypothetical protein GYMLUDRAFT_36681 [Collybiopsis luxurians FD-317 M1]|nr:hypothetical protein GYMLUDRAFT_36681 [Collybiopsis luxurians FD-317 M1]
MTSGIGTLLHAQFHFRQQQAFQRLLASNTAGASDGPSPGGVSLGTSPRSLKSKGLRDEDRLDVNARDGFGRTVLHLASAAVDASSVEYVRLLLKHPGINVNLQDCDGWTALHRAMYVGNLSVVLLLLQHPSTDMTLKDLEGYTAFDLYNSTVEGTKPELSLSPATSALSPVQSVAGAELFTWGANRNASLGHGDSSDRTFPDQVSVPRVVSSVDVPVEDRFARVGVRQVKMGKLHTGVVAAVPLSSGLFGPTLSLCGFGSGGRLGVTQHTQYALRPLSWAAASQNPSAPSRSSTQPRLKVISVALGQDHTLALTENGEVYSWGLNRFSQLGYSIDDGSAAAQVFSLDDVSEFLSQSSFTGNPTPPSNGEQIQLIPRRVYGPLKREFVLGVASTKGASACWVRESGGGGNVYTWGLNGGQLGYDRTTTGASAQIQVLPRKVTKINRPVVQIALGESAMACLLSGAGNAGGGWKGDVLICWGDQVGRVTFPTQTFPSPITPYRPPQALKSTRIVKIVCSDESPPPFSMSALPSSTTTPSATGPPPSSSRKSASNLAAMLNFQSNSSANSASSNHINFACVSEGGEVFVFGVPGVPPVGVLGSGHGDGDLDGKEGSGSSLALAKIVKPQRVWALRRGLVGTVKDVAIGVDGSLIICTDSGHVYVRARSSTSETAFGNVTSSKGFSGGGKSQKFYQIPYLQRIIGVCASNSGAYGALRLDAEVKPIPWPVIEKISVGKKNGRDLRKAVDTSKGWDLIHDMRIIMPWMWRESIDSPLAMEWLEDSVDTTTNSPSVPSPRINSSVQEKRDHDAEEYDDDDGDIDIKKDIKLLQELCALIPIQEKCGTAQWGAKLPYGADLMVFVHSESSSTSTRKSRSKAKLPSGSPALSFPLHSVLLGARSSTMSAALRSPSESLLHCGSDGLHISVSALHSTSTSLRNISFSGFHPLSVLILMHYIYTDELIGIWDRRVSSRSSSSASSAALQVTPTLGLQIKSELQTLANTLALPQMLKALESVVKRPIVETLRRDLSTLWNFDNLDPSPVASRSSTFVPDVVLQLAEGHEIFTYSTILRARSAYFEDFLGEDAWTRERRGDGRLLKVDLQHLKPRVMAYVLQWLCCGQSEGLFGSLEFADTVDAVLEFLFEVIAVANELLLFPLVILTSQLVLKFLNIHNACYILSEAYHYHAYDLMSSVEGYISANLETFLESHMLDTLGSSIVKHLSAFIRAQQEKKSPIVRSHRLVKHAMDKWRDWLDAEDIPKLIMPSSGLLRKQRERKSSQAPKLSSPPSPSPISSLSFSHQKELSQSRSRPIIKHRSSASPVLNPQGSIPESNDIFDMDEVDVGPSFSDPPHSSTGSAWKAASTPRVDMRSVMAEAAQAKPVQLYTTPSARGSPSDGTPFNSVRLRRSGSSQTRLSSAFDISSTPPSPSPAPRPSGSPWRTPASVDKVSTPNNSFPTLGTTPAPKLQDPPVIRGVSNARPPLQASSSGSTLGPVFTPSRQPAAKVQPTIPRRVSSGGATSSSKAWASAPVHEPLPPTLTSTTSKGMSFIAIQQLQLEQGTSHTKDKRSLLEIQEEEQAKREEEDFLKWWEAEEERVRLETQELERMQAGGSDRRGNQNQRSQQKKSKKRKETGMHNPNSGSGRGPPAAMPHEQEANSSQNSKGPNSTSKRVPRNKKGAPAASAS